MVDELAKNNGDILSCLILIMHYIAEENNSAVAFETHHQNTCTLAKGQWPQNSDNLDPITEKAMAHLYTCNCDTNINVTFMKPNGETFCMPLLLSQIKEKYPWLNNDAKEMLTTVKKLGRASPLVKKMKPLFQKHLGYHHMLGPDIPGFSPSPNKKNSQRDR